MTIGILILGDQLWLEQSALRLHQDNRPHIPVLMLESAELARQRPYHRQKLVLVWSAMRHFAQALEQNGWSVTYKIT
ncbi:MAG: hypothetical protein RLZZ568_1475, partial [Cyanobacteriota bacterium]